MSAKFYSLLHGAPPAMRAALGLYSNMTYEEDDIPDEDVPAAADLSEQKNFSKSGRTFFKDKKAVPNSYTGINGVDSGMPNKKTER